MVLLLLSSVQLPAQDENEEKNWSPDQALYAMRLPGEKVGKGYARERFTIYAADGKQVSMIYLWEIEPDGTQTVGTRGCESFGWIDSNRFFCEGTINPSTGVYRYFDAKSGRELGERIGLGFTWSPDLTQIANFGNVSHFSDWDRKSDSLEVGKYHYPEGGWNDKDRHLFRSSITWSPDSRRAAIVDHRISDNGFYLVAIAAATGKQFIWRLRFNETGEDEWPAQHDFTLEWSGKKVTVRLPSGGTEVVEVR